MDEHHLRAASIGAHRETSVDVFKVQGSRFFIIRHIHNHTSIISSEMQVELKKNTDMRPCYAARRIASPTSREKRKPGTGRALAAFDGD